MRYIKKVWKVGNSLVMTLDNGLIRGKGIKDKDEIEIDIIYIKKINSKTQDE